MIPVHNLTSQPVRVRGDQGFIWVEITKLSNRRYGGKPVEFNRDKNARTPKQYFHSANGGRPIVSTLSVTADKIQDLVKWVRTISVYASIAFIVSLVSVLYGGWSLINDTHGYVTSTQKDVAASLAGVERQKEEVGKVLEAISKERAILQAELSELKKRELEIQQRLASVEKARQP
jgi:hypothetical protein